jgi:anti-sigma-K factor RskA
MTRRDDDIPVELRDVAAQLRALGPEEWEPAAPPALRTPVAERQAIVEGRPRARLRGRFAPGLVLRPAIAAAAVLVLVALGTAGGALIAGGDGPRAGREVARQAADGQPHGRAAQPGVGVGAARTVAHGRERVGAGGFYEVWMLRDATHLVALGSFRVGADGRARVDLPVTASPRRFPVLDISREAADGDPGHSGHSVLRSRPIDS